MHTAPQPSALVLESCESVPKPAPGKTNKFISLGNGDLRSLRGIEDYKGAVFLDASCNRLQSMEKELFSLTSVKHLSLSTNLIDAVPSGIAGMKELRVLYLGCNRIETVSDELYGLPMLQCVDLSENRLRVISEAMTSMRSIITVDLSCNYITKMPAKVVEIPSLKNISIAGNPLGDMTNEDVDTLSKSDKVSMAQMSSIGIDLISPGSSIDCAYFLGFSMEDITGSLEEEVDITSVKSRASEYVKKKHSPCCL